MVKRNSKAPLKVIPLGGLHEIGKNTCVFEYGDEIILVDAGLAFPTDGMHGVNIVLPDMTYLRENQDRIKGMIVTHGHEDHIGGIAFHLKQINIPVIYGPRLALSLLSGKLEEAGVSDRTELRTVGPRDTVRLGSNFLIEFIRNTHSMADSFTLAIRTPVGVVIFTGDFKVDHTPVDGEYFDFQKLAEYGEQGVQLLISDSTNSEVPGFTPSERAVFPNLDREIGTAEGRVMVTTFASSVHRVNMILEIAAKHKRKVGIIGRSMLNVIAKARELGYVRCSDDLFVPLKEIRNCKDSEVLILSTGSQGEEMAAMTRIARGEHQQVKVKPGDTIIFSANPIPGNTISVVNTIDMLMMQGANVVYGKAKGIHVSGHGCQEDQKLMIALTRPKFFLPVHGEHRMLVKHSQTAQSMGVPKENMLIIDNGDIVELGEDFIQIGGKVPSGVELVDGSRKGMVDNRALKERQQLAGDGMVVTTAIITNEGKLLREPEVRLRGMINASDHSRFQGWIRREVDMVLKDRWVDFKGSDSKGNVEIDWAGVQTQIEVGIQRRLRRELQSNPMIMVVVQPEDASAQVAVVSSPSSDAKPKAAAGRKVISTKSSAKPDLEDRKALPKKVDVQIEEESATAKTGLRRRRSSARKKVAVS
ncbi:MAG: ribonuclease J [Synechococcales cyanobacterium RM1_1_8]|nr:ribonuclease J [Synechococcales cyanobacterium RM1_1_8]